jgi:hypothetical protein
VQAGVWWVENGIAFLYHGIVLSNLQSAMWKICLLSISSSRLACLLWPEPGRVSTPAFFSVHTSCRTACKLQEGSKADPLWDVACNPSSPHFGMQPLVARDGRWAPMPAYTIAAQTLTCADFPAGSPCRA